MTQRGDGKVSLSGGNWIGIALTVVGGLLAQWLLMNSRVTTLEVNNQHQEKRLDGIDDRIDTTRREILDELRNLRTDLTK